MQKEYGDRTQLERADDLPEEIRTRENQKLRESFEQAQEEIRYALRAGFKDLVDQIENKCLE
jgi:hypothetical protein